MFTFHIQNQQAFLVIPDALIHQALELTFRQHQIHNADVNVILMDNHSIQEYNRKFLNHDYPTDVITFALHELSVPLSFVEGEILVSTETAMEFAPDFEWSPVSETLFYIVHGALHLCGYDDRDLESREMMHQLQHQILNQLQLHS